MPPNEDNSRHVGWCSMTAKVEKKINGLTVQASPIFKGGVQPAYWTCVINEEMVAKTFHSASEVFRFARTISVTNQSRTH